MIKSEQDKRDKKILEAYNRGESVRMIAARFGLSTQQTYNILGGLGITFKKRLDK